MEQAGSMSANASTFLGVPIPDGWAESGFCDPHGLFVRAVFLVRAGNYIGSEVDLPGRLVRIPPASSGNLIPFSLAVIYRGPISGLQRSAITFSSDRRRLIKQGNKV